MFPLVTKAAGMMITRSDVRVQVLLGHLLATLLVVVALHPRALGAQDMPPDSVPAGAERNTVALSFVTQDLTFVVEDVYRVRETAREVLIELSADVLFDFDKADIKASAVTSLKRAATQIRESARGDVRVEGHTDSKGSNEYNQTLSEQRADAVRNWFVSESGIADLQFVARGFGETRPVVPNEKGGGEDDPLGRQRNRRVEIIVMVVD